jgi:hypothetical protein
MSSTGFHADQAGRQPCDELRQLGARDAGAHQRGFACGTGGQQARQEGQETALLAHYQSKQVEIAANFAHGRKGSDHPGVWLAK